MKARRQEKSAVDERIGGYPGNCGTLGREFGFLVIYLIVVGLLRQ
jgi:hypothetical protein